MSVHQIHEFYVHLTIMPTDRDKIIKLCLDESWDYDMYDGDLTVDKFDSKYEAEKCEQMIVGNLSC